MSGRGRVVGVAQAFKESLDLPASVPGVLVAPTVTAVPPGRTVVETGDVPWDMHDLERHVRAALARLSGS